MTSKKTKLPDLETSLTEINELVQRMEEGELTIEQSLSHFERGIQLIKHAQKILQHAEQKVQILLKENGEEKLTNFETNEE